MKIFRTAVSAALLCTVCLVSCADARLVLRAGHSAQPSFHMHKAWLKFQELVQKGSHGEINIEIYPADELGTSLEQLENTKNGRQDLCSEALPLLGTWYPGFGAAEMPYIFTSRDQALGVLNTGSFAERLSGQMESLNLKNLGIAENGFRQITNNVRPVTKPEDLKGLRIRTMEVPSHIAAYDQFGAIPVPMGFGEVYEALRQGKVDGQDNPLSQIAASHFYEVQKYLTVANIVFSADVVVMNMDKYMALKPEHQELLKNSMKEALEYQQTLIKAEEQEDLEFFRQQGLKVNILSEEQIKVFQAEVDKIRGLMIAKVGQKNWEALQQGIAEYNAAHP